MKITLLLVAILVTFSSAQDVVQVICAPDSITARVQKEMILMSGHKMNDLHLIDRTCRFDEEDGDFFARVISPLTSCGTYYTANDTHVVFKNSLTTVEAGPSFPYGVIVGSKGNGKAVSAMIQCTYRIDLNVSTMFIPNITIIYIKLPDAYGIGEFQAGMALYTDSSYTSAYNTPPIMDPDSTLYVGVMLLGDVSSDVYLLMEECWGTISADPSGSPKYPLIQDGCPVRSAADGLVRITQNGIGHQAMWNSPVFKFVGQGEEFDNVWLHCDLQLCINKPCQPSCASGRKRRALGDGNPYGPKDFKEAETHIITVGPITKISITQIYPNGTKTIYVQENQVVEPRQRSDRQKYSDEGFGHPAVLAVVGVLGSLAFICIILALVAVIARAYKRPSNTGVDLSGLDNKAYA